MKPSVLFLMTALRALASSSPAFAQDALTDAFRKCVESGAPDDQIKYCIMVVNAKGLDRDEVAFAYISASLTRRRAATMTLCPLTDYNAAVAAKPNNAAILYMRGAAEKTHG